MGQKNTSINFCCKTDDPMRSQYQQHTEFIDKMAKQRIEISKLVNSRFQHQPWVRSMISVLQQYKSYRHETSQLKNEVERSLLKNMGQDQHYQVGGFNVESMSDSDVISSTEMRKDFKTELMKECIFDQALEKRLGSKFKVNNLLRKSPLYNNNTFINSITVHPEFTVQQANMILNAIQEYKIVTQVIESHVKRDGNVLSATYNLYLMYFSQYYQASDYNIMKRNQSEYTSSAFPQPPSLNHSRSSCNDEYSVPSLFSSGTRSCTRNSKEINKWKGFMHRAIDDLKGFVIYLTTMIVNHYQLSQANKNSLLTVDNLINFCVSLLFSSKQIYGPIMVLHHEGLLQQNKVFQRFIIKHKPSNISDFGINDRFQLTSATIRYIREKNQALEDPRGSKGNTYESIGFANIQDGQSSIYLEGNHRIPYIKAIEFIRNISEVQSPIHKLKVLVQTCQMIDKSIKEFYETFRAQQNNCNYDADQFISILIYIITQSEVENFDSHVKLIQNFAIKKYQKSKTNSTWNSSAGYILTSFKAAIQHMTEGNHDDIDRQSSTLM